jgi:hypothetical protein
MYSSSSTVIGGNEKKSVKNEQKIKMKICGKGKN